MCRDLHAWAPAPENVNARYVCVLCGATYRNEKTRRYNGQRAILDYIATLVEAGIVEHHELTDRRLRRDVQEVAP